jgi:AraC-like DNA-binding protein
VEVKSYCVCAECRRDAFGSCTLRFAVVAARLTGALFTYPTHVLYVGPLIGSARHDHHAGQVIFAPGGLIVEDEDGSRRRVTAHVVAPDTPHCHGAAAAAAVLWVDRDDLPWDRVRKTPPDVCSALAATLSARLDASLAPDDAREVARALLDAVAPTDRSEALAPRHPAVRRMCALLDTSASDREISVTQLAQQSGLSMRQLRHRFTEELGVNPRAYLRWRRLRRAFTCIERGATLTDAALEGGFADGAHFSRVFQAQFGMAPSQALSSVRFAGRFA